MEKITFVNNVTKANAETFNTMQDNIEDAINDTIDYIDGKTTYHTNSYSSNGATFRFEKMGRVVVMIIEGATNSNLVANTNYTFTISSEYTPTQDFRSNVVLLESGQTVYITISGTTVSYRTYTNISSPTYPRSSLTYIASN